MPRDAVYVDVDVDAAQVCRCAGCAVVNVVGGVGEFVWREEGECGGGSGEVVVC